MTAPATHEKNFNFEQLNWDKARKIFKDGRKGKTDEKKLDEFLKERTSLQDAKEACKATQKAAGEEYAPALGSILGKIDIAMSVGDLAIKSAPESIGLVWMGIRLCLHSVADDFSTFNIFGTACSDIIGILISCAVYGRMYGVPQGPESFQEIHGQVCDRIPKIYAEILDFSFSVKKHMGRNKAIRIGKGMITQSSANFSSKIKSIREHETVMSEFARKAHEQLSAYYHKLGQENQASIIGSLSDIEKKMELSLKVNQDCLAQIHFLNEERKSMKKMSPLEIAMKNFEENIKKLNASSDQKEAFATKIAKRSPPQTCTWIFKQKEYENWLASKESRLLWISGGGGFGKSILMSAIIEELQKQSTDNGSIVNYFFCNAGDEATKMTARILKHLLFQLYQLVESQPLEMVEKANKIMSSFLGGKTGASKSQTSSAGKDHEGKKGEVGFSEAYCGLAELFGKPVFVVIDALDECSDRQSEGLVRLIRDMINEPELGIKVLVCSRPDLASELDGVPTVKVEDNNGPDIRLNAETELKKLPGWTSREREIASKKIVEKAGSFFRYVELAVGFLKQPWQRPIEKYLEQLPEGLQAFYEQIIRNTDPLYMGLLNTCLTWTILANGQIKVTEIVDAYSRTYTEGDDSAIEDCTPQSSDAGEDLHIKQIRTAGSALLEVDAKSRVIKLRHNTVADYFLTAKLKTKPSAAEYACECENCKVKRQTSNAFELSEKQGHLVIATTICECSVRENIAEFRSLMLQLVRHLTSEPFRKKYLVPFEKTEVLGTYIGDGTESDAEPENPENPDIKDSDPQSNTASSAKQPAIEEANTSNDAGVSSGDSDAQTAMAVESSTDPSNIAVPGIREPELQANGIEPPLLSEQKAKDATTEETDNKASVEDDAASKDGSDDDSDAGVEDREDRYSWEEPADPSVKFRYEVNHCHYHLRKVEELWEPEDRQGPGWAEFEQLRDSFFQDDSLAFRSWVNLRCQARHSEISWVDDATTVKPIHLAAAYGLTSIVTKLIECSVNLHAKTDEGYSPLQFAAEYYGSLEEPKTRGIELMELLLKNEADPNQKTRNFSALCILIFQDPKVDAIELFLKYKADATWKHRNWKQGILHYFVMCCNNIEVLHALITAGADPNAKDLWGETPLHILMKGQDPSTEILEALIVAGADVNAEDSSSQRPLYEASVHGNVKAACILIENGADIMDDDLDKMTALHMACQFGHREFTRLLLDKGARIAELDARGRTPFYLACEAESDETALSLIEELDPKDHAVFTLANSDGKTPLRKAAARGHKKVVEMLFEKLGYDLTSLSTQDTKLGQTPLHAAAYNGQKSVVEFLIGNQAPTKIKDKHGNTPLKSCFDGWTEAKSEDYEAICLRLMEIDPKVAVQDPEILRIAAMRGSIPVIKKLLEAGADPMKQDEHGWTSVQLAQQYARIAAVEVLSNHHAVVGLQPSRFRSTLPKTFRMSEDGNEVEFISTKEHIAASVLSDHPIPAGVRGHYYEIEVLDPGQKEPGEVAFGFCHRPARLRKWLPGWSEPNPNISSWAYHGDDAGLWMHPRKGYTAVYLEKYGHGDIMGCGIDFEKNTIFYTRNGELILVTRQGQTPEKSYYAYTKVTGRLHAVLGTSYKTIIRVNFGNNLEVRPFKWESANGTNFEDGGFVDAVTSAEEEFAKTSADKPLVENGKAAGGEEKTVVIISNPLGADDATTGA